MQWSPKLIPKRGPLMQYTLIYILYEIEILLGDQHKKRNRMTCLSPGNVEDRYVLWYQHIAALVKKPMQSKRSDIEKQPRHTRKHGGQITL